MTTVRWKLFATLAEVTDESELSLELPGENPTVSDALTALVEAHPALRSHVLTEDDELHAHIKLLYEGQDVFADATGWETTVGDGDELALFPPVTGG